MSQTDLLEVQGISHRVDLHISIMEECNAGLEGHESSVLMLATSSGKRA